MKNKLILTILALGQIINGFSQTTNLKSINGLRGWWKFDSNSKDSSNFKNNGTSYNTSYTTDRFNQPNKAIYFNGTNSVIKMDSTYFAGTIKDKFSFAFWIKTSINTNTGSYTIIHKDGFWRSVGMGIDLSKRVLSFSGSYPSPQQYWGGSSSYKSFGKDTNWHHWAITFDKGKLTFYQDGKKDTAINTYGQVDFSYYAAGNSNSINYIGASNSVSNGDHNYFKGALDEFAYWGGVLDSIQIKNIGSTYSSVKKNDTVIIRDTVYTCPQNCKFILLDSMILDATKAFNKSFKTSINKKYKIEISGTIGVANGTPEFDALYILKIGGKTQNPPIFLASNPVKWNNSDSFQNFAQNKSYNVNHSYSWIFNSKDSFQRFLFSDNPYSDNSGFYNIKLYAEVCTNSSKRDTIYVHDTIKTTSLCEKSSQTCESCIDSDSKLVGCWTFNGNAKDRLNNHKDGIVKGAKLVKDRFGNTNAAYSFDGNSYIEIPDSFKVVKNFTTSCWIKPDFSKSWNWLGILSDGSSREKGGYDFFMGVKSDQIIHRADKPIAKGYTEYKYNYNFDSSWYHIVWVCGDSGQIVYVNGKYVGSTKDRGGNLGSHNKYALIGAWIYNSYSTCDSWTLKNNPEMCKPHNNFQGVIDDIKMWNALLDSNQILKVYKCPVNMTTFNDTVTVKVTVFDTLRTTIYDTIAVQDTLLINAKLTGTTPLQTNLIKVYPNPAKDHLIIDFGNYSSMAGYEINIFDVAGKSVYSSTINKSNETIDLNTWTGKGVYFLKIYDKLNQQIENRKIVIQ